MFENILNSYSIKTLKQINKLLDEGHDEIIEVIKFKYDEKLLITILNWLNDGHNIKIFQKYKFDGYQMEQIRLGIEKDLNVFLYANPKFTADDMSEIRLGLEKGLEVSLYANPEFNANQMHKIMEKIKEKKAPIIEEIEKKIKTKKRIKKI